MMLAIEQSKQISAGAGGAAGGAGAAGAAGAAGGAGAAGAAAAAASSPAESSEDKQLRLALAAHCCNQGHYEVFRSVLWLCQR